jgi:hypothetical protein
MENQFNLTTIQILSFKYTSPEGQSGLPEQGVNAIVLEQNYPNPFSGQTTIRYRINSAGHVVLKVFDFLGKEVATLVNETKSPGKYETVFNASGLPAGVYYCKLSSSEYTLTKKMIISGKD